MANRGLSIAPGVVIELVGDEVVAVVPGKTAIIKFTGENAEVLHAIHAGREVKPSDDIREELVTSGVVSSPKGVSRRALVRTGLVGAGAGVAVLAMPSVANAASPSGNGGSSENSEGGSDEGDLVVFSFAQQFDSGNEVIGIQVLMARVDGSGDLISFSAGIPDGTSGRLTLDNEEEVALTYDLDAPAGERFVSGDLSNRSPRIGRYDLIPEAFTNSSLTHRIEIFLPGGSISGSVTLTTNTLNNQIAYTRNPIEAG